LAVEALDRVGPEDDVTVWLAKEAPTVALSPTTGHEVARRVLDAARPTLEDPSLLGTLELARRAVDLADQPATLLVITDAPGAASLPRLEANELLVAVDQGSRPSDAASDRVENYRWDPSEPIGSAEVVVVHREGEPRPRRVVVEVDGEEVGAAPVTPSITGPERLVVAVPNDLEGVLVARLTPPDAFPENDVSGLVVRRPRPLRVVVTAPDAGPSPFLLEALGVLDGLVDREATLVTTPDAPASVLAVADVVIAEGALPGALPEATPLLAFSEALGESVPWPAVWESGPAGEEHPVLRGVDLAPLRIDRAAVRSAGAGETRLVDSAAGALAFASEARDDRARRVLLGFRPDASTLPLEAAFPLLVRNALRWLRGGPPLPGALRAGDPLPARRATAQWADRAPRTEAGELLLPLAPEDEPTVARVPRPSLGRSRLLAVATPAGTGEAYVRWDRPETVRLGFDGDLAFAKGIEALPDRRGARDTRERWAPRLAGLAALLLVLGALLLPLGRRAKRRRRPAQAPPPAGRPAIPVGSLTLDMPLPEAVRDSVR
jgi:hypothetical protein